MIRSTFQILDRVSDKTEKNIWAQGIIDWEDFLVASKIKGISEFKKSHFDRKILEARKALYGFKSDYFIDKLISTETWRLYRFFQEESVFLDIETEGVGKNSDIVVIGLYDGVNTKTMIKGVNLDYHQLRNELARYKLILTFNGGSFDIPFIRKRYDILPNVPHIDVMHCASRIGLKGGLKKIEKEMGLKRKDIICKFVGGDPLTLWRMYNGSGDRYYLNLLVEYNDDDIINLKYLMDFCYMKLCDHISNNCFFRGLKGHNSADVTKIKS